MHLEQILVESNYDDGITKKSCYDFTSVGAFTTVHMTKPRPNSIEALMRSEANKIPALIIKNEVTLMFYTLKIFIYILNDLTLINRTDDKIQVINFRNI